MSVLMTLSDLERRDAKGPVFRRMRTFVRTLVPYKMRSNSPWQPPPRVDFCYYTAFTTGGADCITVPSVRLSVRHVQTHKQARVNKGLSDCGVETSALLLATMQANFLRVSDAARATCRFCLRVIAPLVIGLYTAS